LPDKSKKVSKFGDPALEVGQTVHQLGHATAPEEEWREFNGGER
jgi:hypothetical protein